MALQGRVLAGRYELGPRLGAGGMASVYQATDQVLDRTVAVKVLGPPYDQDPDFVDQFRHEARMAAGLGHPNVVAIFDSASEGDLHYIVMEYVQGQTLAELLRRHGRLPPGLAAEVAHRVCLALEAAHERGLVHRDIKPANVMVDQAGLVKVMDFGIAKAAAATTTTMLNSAGQLLGTAPYLSPEQAQGRPVDGRSDLYALGCVLYELLTGRRPFRQPGNPVCLGDDRGDRWAGGPRGCAATRLEPLGAAGRGPAGRGGGGVVVAERGRDRPAASGPAIHRTVGCHDHDRPGAADHDGNDPGPVERVGGHGQPDRGDHHRPAAGHDRPGRRGPAAPGRGRRACRPGRACRRRPQEVRGAGAQGGRANRRGQDQPTGRGCGPSGARPVRQRDAAFGLRPDPGILTDRVAECARGMLAWTTLALDPPKCGSRVSGCPGRSTAPAADVAIPPDLGVVAGESDRLARDQGCRWWWGVRIVAS